MSSNISDILKQLDSLNAENGIEVFVPSLKKSIKFKSLNLRQQKELLKSSIDESLTKLSFNTLFYNVIQENILETLSINQMYTFDRIAIALALRAKGLDSKYDLQGTTLDLNKKLSEIQTINVDLQPLKASFDDTNITVNVQAPQLGVDRELNNYALNKSKTSESEDFKVVIGELFVYELTKFITSVTMKNGETPVEIDFSLLKTADKLAVVEKLPSTVTNSILEFIKAHRTFESSFAKIDDTIIDIDGSFFTV